MTQAPWRLVGQVSMDGLLFVGDPSHQRNGTPWDDWQSFCAQLRTSGVVTSQVADLSPRGAHEGMVVCRMGLQGHFPVRVRRNAFGDITAVMVEFNTDCKEIDDERW